MFLHDHWEASDYESITINYHSWDDTNLAAACKKTHVQKASGLSGTGVIASRWVVETTRWSGKTRGGRLDAALTGSVPWEIPSCHQDHLEPAPTRLWFNLLGMCIRNHKWIRHVKVLRVLRSSTTVETEVCFLPRRWGRVGDGPCWSKLFWFGKPWWLVVFSNDDLMKRMKHVLKRGVETCWNHQAANLRRGILVIGLIQSIIDIHLGSCFLSMSTKVGGLNTWIWKETR